jgi:hypothetical protein
MLLAALAGVGSLHADPCGMVPPCILPTDPDRSLTRIGDQLTYVFFKDGIMDMVLRAGFKGRVSEFGMLIPFPSVPEIRKMPDGIFEQIAKAVEPPTVTIDLSPDVEDCRMCCDAAPASGMRAPLEYDTVRVLKEEAVGMYQVAVLEADSPKALEGWMTAHQFIYPKGMDAVCMDFIRQGWVFVVVKARIGDKAKASPRPGMRDASNPLPEDATFNGVVQAMGFRYRTKEPVVPMRLAAYNPGELHNIVYYLGDRPCRFSQLPEGFVKHQIPGRELVANLTELLPAKIQYWDTENGNWQQKVLEVKRGEFRDLPKKVLEQAGAQDPRFSKERDPAPANGLAKSLFTSDMLALSTGRLSHPFEERHKELVNIAEELGQRGPAVDALIHEALADEMDEALAGMMKDLGRMTLTVIEGDIPRETMAKESFTFAEYRKR